LENALLSAYNTEDLGSLSDDDTSEVNESVDLSADEVYDIVASTWTVNAGDLVTNEVVDVVICDEVSCGGDCGDPSMGCNRIFAITLQAGGSPGTQGDIVFSVDGGTDWYAHDIDSLGVAEDPSAVDCLKGYIVVVSNDNGYAHYALISEFDEFGTDPDFTEVQLGFVAPPNDIYALDTMAFIVGDFGYIYRMDVAPNGVMVLDAGTLTISNLLRVHALSDSFAVATGEDGVILFTEDGTAWQLLVTPPVGVGVNITAVAVKSKTEWWIGTDAGDLYYTLNAGLNWTDIVFSTDSIMYVSYINDTPVGVIVASFNGGYDFVAMPLGTALFPANLALNRIAACEVDPELVVTVGIEAGADGIIVTGVM
jgi:photosystem II stability/assembly factor-like uncharacterized protein